MVPVCTNNNSKPSQILVLLFCTFLCDTLVVLSPQLSNLPTHDLSAIESFISRYSHEIDKYFT
jgi:hypothetical protein